MFFINFSKCTVCNQKKSVASTREDRKKRCIDCDRDFYLRTAESQKRFWLSSKSNN